MREWLLRALYQKGHKRTPAIGPQLLIGVLIRQSQFNVLVEQRDVVFTAYFVD